MILQDLVVGRGELHFDLFEPGTKAGKGERYLGNTPGFSLSVREDAVTRKGLSRGLKVVTERHVTERTYEGDIVCDQMSAENLALWQGAIAESNSVAATGGGPVVVENIGGVYRGYGYQLGLTDNPLGHRNLQTVTFKIGSVPVAIPGNIVVDSNRGRFQVLADAPDIADGATLTVEYKHGGYERRSAGAPRTQLEGALRFISFNFVGRKNDLFFPYVSLEPKGAIDLKTSDWQTINFNVTVMQRLGHELFYEGHVT